MINNTSLQLHTDEEWLRREEATLSSQPARQYKPQHYHDAPQDCANDISRRHGKVEPKKILEGSAYIGAYISLNDLIDVHCHI